MRKFLKLITIVATFIAIIAGAYYLITYAPFKNYFNKTVITNKLAFYIDYKGISPSGVEPIDIIIRIDGKEAINAGLHVDRYYSSTNYFEVPIKLGKHRLEIMSVKGVATYNEPVTVLSDTYLNVKYEYDVKSSKARFTLEHLPGPLEEL